MNFGLYLHQARRWILAAILPALLVTLVSYLYVQREPKQYQTSTILYVQQADASGGTTDIYTSQALIPTYSQMIGSPIIAREVDRAMAKRYPGYQLEGNGLVVGGPGSVGAQASTQLMTITVTDTIPKRAAVAADTVANVFIKKIVTIQRARFAGGEKAIQRQLNVAQVNIQDVSQKITTYKGSVDGLANLRAQLNAYQSIYQTLLTSSQQFTVSRNTALNGVQIFSPAQVPGGPIGPHPSRTALLYGFLALLVCAGGVFGYDYFDDSPRTPEEVEELVGSPVLGTVQEFDTSKYSGQLVTKTHGRSPTSEAYRVIRTNLQFTDVDHPPRVVVVTSSSPKEGKSTTISNLAQVFAEAGKRVMLVDGDLRRPSLHTVFALTRQDGLTTMLTGTQDLNGASSQQTEQANLTLIASGPLPPRPADLLGSARMRELIGHLGRQADLVLIDSPPLLAVTDASILSTVTDGVILVVDPSKSKRRDLRRAREAIEAVGGRILGVVINRLNKRGSSYYYYYYQHNYGYQYKYDYGLQGEAASTSQTVSGHAIQLEPRALLAQEVEPWPEDRRQARGGRPVRVAIGFGAVLAAAGLAWFIFHSSPSPRPRPVALAPVSTRSQPTAQPPTVSRSHPTPQPRPTARPSPTHRSTPQVARAQPTARPTSRPTARPTLQPAPTATSPPTPKPTARPQPTLTPIPTVMVPTPAGLGARQVSAAQVVLSWTGVPHATGYLIVVGHKSYHAQAPHLAITGALQANKPYSWWVQTTLQNRTGPRSANGVIRLRPVPTRSWLIHPPPVGASAPLVTLDNPGSFDVIAAVTVGGRSTQVSVPAQGATEIAPWDNNSGRSASDVHVRASGPILAKRVSVRSGTAHSAYGVPLPNSGS